MRALALGSGILVLSAGAWFAAVAAHWVPGPLVVGLQASPGIASLAAAWAAPRHRVLVGMSMVPMFLVVLLAGDLLSQAFGGSDDFAGPGGAVTLVMLTLLWASIVCACGTACGVAAAGFTRSRSTSPPAGET